VNQESVIIFIIVAFSFSLIIIMKRDAIPPRFRRGLALTSAVMVVIAFALLLYSFFI
jgi:mannose/fructose/N-acetylgalactosamine-specific phosphotransferase system component IIC